ncbi:hypothetical protein CB1_001960001 [Camelus ferus]|nr:hypothetical protein CB1_001960001 [Camelus ferus]
MIHPTLGDNRGKAKTWAVPGGGLLDGLAIYVQCLRSSISTDAGVSQEEGEKGRDPGLRPGRCGHFATVTTSVRYTAAQSHQLSLNQCSSPQAGLLTPPEPSSLCSPPYSHQDRVKVGKGP